MRTFIFFVCSVLASAAFQISLVIWPQKFQAFAPYVKWLWALSVLLFLIWLFSHPWLKRLFNLSQTAQAASVPATPSITVSPTISPVITVASNAEPSRTSPPSREPRRREIQEPRGPNIIFTRCTSRKIYFQGEGSRVEFNEEKGEEFPDAVIACFRNEPDISRRGVDADCVTAQIIYRNAENEEIEDGVPAACWLGSSLDMIDFRVGETHCVLLGVVDGDALAVPWQRRKHEWNGDSITTEDRAFKGVARIEVRLIGARNELLLKPIVFDFSVVDGQPRIAKRADP